MGCAFRPGFTPELTPKQMLELGVFGGKYMTDCRKEFPASWFTRAKLSPDRPRALLNYFGVNASQPLSEWRRKAWIDPEDPRDWFQWYCRYYCGRRSQNDLRQITRWRAIRRHVAQLKKHCRPRDLNCRRRQRQALLHWAYDRERSDHKDLRLQRMRSNGQAFKAETLLPSQIAFYRGNLISSTPEFLRYSSANTRWMPLRY